MQVIPVIDLKHGVAVHAVKGQRDQYRPLRSRLCDSPAPLAVLKGLLELYPFRSVYLADLNALTGDGDNGAIIQQLIHAFPAVEFWIDQGWPANNGTLPANHVPVLSSESMEPARLDELPLWRARSILSLDFFDDSYVGPGALLSTPTLWPPRVILMTLAQVGSSAGPNWARLEAVLADYPQFRWIAAGGVRHADDLRQLEQLGMHAALVASSLHQGYLSSAALEQYQ